LVSWAGGAAGGAGGAAGNGGNGGTVKITTTSTSTNVGIMSTRGLRLTLTPLGPLVETEDREAMVVLAALAAPLGEPAELVVRQVLRQWCCSNCLRAGSGQISLFNAGIFSGGGNGGNNDTQLTDTRLFLVPVARVVLRQLEPVEPVVQAELASGRQRRPRCP